MEIAPLALASWNAGYTSIMTARDGAGREEQHMAHTPWNETGPVVRTSDAARTPPREGRGGGGGLLNHG